MELGAITAIVEATIENIYKYKNSALGIMQAITTDYSNVSLEAKDIQQSLKNGEGIEFLKEVLTKLG